MIASDEFVAIFGSVPSGDEEATIKVIVAAVRAGFAIVLCKPGEKTPLCTLNAIERNRADRATREAAHAAGDPGADRRRHPCGLSHALTRDMVDDPTKLAARIGTIVRRVIKERGGVNIGVELGRSRCLVVDVDTAGELQGFMGDWSRAIEHPETGSWMPGITVRSPGRKLDDGTWVHKDGGHYWFTLPDGVELPGGTGSWRAPSGWVAMWADHQVLVPPSRRPEGAYQLVGQPSPAPAWLIDRLLSEGAARAARQKDRATRAQDGSSDIDKWAAGVPWAELLDQDGWTDTGLPDACSCPIWTAPGPHSSPKSATAHDMGCDHYDTSPGHAPLHVWTDNPPAWMAEAIARTGSKTFTRLQYIAWRDHEGVMLAALRAVGLREEDPGYNAGAESPIAWEMQQAQQAARDDADDDFGTPGPAPDDGDESHQSHEDGCTEDGTDGTRGTDGKTTGQEASEPARDLTMVELLRRQLVSSAGLDDIEDPEPLVEGFFDLDTLGRVTGFSGHGKSFVMLDMAACIATGQSWHGFSVRQGPVLYVVAEGLRGFKKRVRAWEARYHGGQHIAEDALYLMKVPVQIGDPVQWSGFRELCAEIRPVLVVLDTQARVTVGMKENDATEMGVMVARMDAIRHATEACVITVHHLGHVGEHGRGSTAVIGALGAEVRVVQTKKGRRGTDQHDELEVHSEKQKDQEGFEPIRFRLDPEGEGSQASAVIVPNGWEPGGDPFAAPGPVSTGPSVTEDSSARDRMCAVLWETFNPGEGATRAELRTAMTHHPVYGKVSRTTLFRAWSEMLRDKVLEQQTNADGKLLQRWKLKPEEAARLGLGPLPARPVELPPAPVEGDEGSQDDSGSDVDGPESETGDGDAA